jgi:hypothetical protein
MNALDPPLLLQCGPLVLLPFQVRCLALEFGIAGKPAFIDSTRCHRAPRLTLVPAIAKPALLRQIRDVSERQVDAFSPCPQLQLAKPGRIHDEPAVGSQK